MNTTTKVRASRGVDFPAFGWSIARGEEKDLPADKEVAEAILRCRHISIIKDVPVEKTPEPIVVPEMSAEPVEAKHKKPSKK